MLAVVLFGFCFMPGPVSSQVLPYTYYFPHLALGGGWQTTITYVNFSPQTIACQTNFYSDAGSPLFVSFGGPAVSTLTITLPPGGTIHDESKAELSTPEVRGWAKVQCSAPIKTSLLFRFYQNGAQGEASVNAMTSPATKFVTFADQNTGVAYANPSSQAAQVTLNALSAVGEKLASKTLTLLAGEHGAANVGPLLGLSNFKGSIQIVSPVPIISLSLNAEAFPVFSSLPPGELDDSTVLATGDNSNGGSQSGLTATNIRALAIDPANTSAIYAGADVGIFKSTNGGQSWTALYAGSIQALAIDPASPTTIYAGEFPSTIAKSTDGGQNWTKIPLPIGIGAVSVVAIDPSNSKTVHVGSYVGILKSTDGGITWSFSKSGLDVLALGIDPKNPFTIYAGIQGSNAGVWKSTNGGQNWGQLFSFQGAVRTLAIDPVNTQTIYVGNDSGISKTTDGGLTWAELKNFISASWTLAINSINPAIIYAGAPGFGVFKSADGGQNWSFVGLTALTVQTLVLDPRNPAVIYAGTQGAGMYKSTDSGANWQHLGD
ncbi:MAG: hypothetical protein HY313_12060 [Acidobacteria bacterium]|nr:hypothetical protein [Acidobacteriota bacterium]